MNIDNNSINILGHKITIEDMVENLYYRTDISLSKNEMGLKLLYINNLNERDRNHFHYLTNAKISEASKNANYNKPIFKFIDMKDKDLNEEYFLDIENNDYKSKSIDYKINNTNYKIKIYQTEDDKYKFNHRDWSWHISYLEPFYSTLKFKIKEERITRKLRKEFNDYKIITDNNYYKLLQEFNEFKKKYYNNDIYLKYYIIVFSFINIYHIINNE